MSFKIKQNDTSPSIQANLTDYQLNPIDLTNSSVKFHMKSVDGTLKVSATTAITDAEGGVVQYNWQNGTTDTVGTYYVEFQVTYPDGTVETFPNTGSLTVVVIPELN